MIRLHPTFHPNFVQFLKEFNDTTDYFECHELLEEYWKEVSPNEKNHPLTALILLSTSMYHWRRGNLKGALKTMHTSLKRFANISNSAVFETIAYQHLIDHMNASLSLIKESGDFKPFSILIKDPKLKDLVHNFPIGERMDLHFLTHKHMLRDRSEILEEREKSKKRRDDY